ncbi:Peptide methionine sulfoxide reductase B5 [Basidiobolus ranarum]|uniref:Peptide-methionine (R)-S-oxide reductase n=1 Tax=Basidiobolus ranarum TaxID=34480 RepID=A0ABR2W2A4_9FUNG
MLFLTKMFKTVRPVSTRFLGRVLPPVNSHLVRFPNALRVQTFTTSNGFHQKKTEEEWRVILNPEQFHVLREKGTEAPYSGEYDQKFDQGVYHCTGCDAPLYTSDTKFGSNCGWPAFFQGIPGAIERHQDETYGMKRTEITCSACGGHLGHVFKGEGYDTPTDERHCVNSISLRFTPKSQ